RTFGSVSCRRPSRKAFGAFVLRATPPTSFYALSYTTLFRSSLLSERPPVEEGVCAEHLGHLGEAHAAILQHPLQLGQRSEGPVRSEEHTSELQSREKSRMPSSA